MKASADTWADAVRVILSGEPVAFPTDTVYGVGCDPYNVGAIRAIYALKGRSSQKALPLLLSSAERLSDVSPGLSPFASRLAATLWPGALTLVVPRRPELPVELSGDNTIAVRVPNSPDLCAFLEMCGGYIAATSANISGMPDALTATDVHSYFPSGVGLIVDGGTVRGGRPSTVVDCTGQEPRLLREGPIKMEEIERALRGQGLE